MFAYARVEKALAAELGIGSEELPAFAARLRHLRNLGIPETKPGSGRRISYSMENAQLMLIALLLEAVGCSPRFAATAAETYKKHRPTRPELVVVSSAGDAIPSNTERLLSLLRVNSVVAVLNLRRAFSRLEATLLETGQGR